MPSRIIAWQVKCLADFVLRVRNSCKNSFQYPDALNSLLKDLWTQAVLSKSTSPLKQQQQNKKDKQAWIRQEKTQCWAEQEGRFYITYISWITLAKTVRNCDTAIFILPWNVKCEQITTTNSLTNSNLIGLANRHCGFLLVLRTRYWLVRSNRIELSRNQLILGFDVSLF